jgi:hypothetical protein
MSYARCECIVTICYKEKKVNVRHAWLNECAVRAKRQKLKLSSDGGDSGSKKYKRGYGGAYGGDYRNLCLVGVWSQAVGFVLVRVAGI